MVSSGMSVERACAIGLWGAIAGVAIAMGSIVGGWLLEHFNWVSIFIAMAPIAAAAAILVALINPADPVVGIHGPAGLHHHRGAGLRMGSRAHPGRLGGLGQSCLSRSSCVSGLRLHPMLDVRLFRNLQFGAASGAVTVPVFTRAN
jgi:MFS family permease